MVVPPVDGVFRRARRRQRLQVGFAALAVVSVIVGTLGIASPWHSGGRQVTPAVTPGMSQSSTPIRTDSPTSSPVVAKTGDGCSAHGIMVTTALGTEPLDQVPAQLSLPFGSHIVIEPAVSCGTFSYIVQTGSLVADPIQAAVAENTNRGGGELVANQPGPVILQALDTASCPPSPAQCDPVVIGTFSADVSAPQVPAITAGGALAQAQSYLQTRTKVPVLLPASLPVATLSAQATGTNASYQVTLYNCPTALSLNDPAIASSTCSGDAALYGSVDAEQEPSQAAAEGALPLVATETPATLGCPAGSHGGVSNDANVKGVRVSTLTCPGAPGGEAADVEMQWSERGWNVFLLFGSESSLTQTLLDTAGAVVTSLQASRLPASSGLFRVNVAADGEHSEAAWTSGPNIYLLTNDHSATAAVAMMSNLQSSGT